MARPNPLRSIEGESNLAKRIAVERRQREWSYEALSRRMSEAGCPINSSAIYKIEKGDPPRKITVDELLAFASVFETTVEDLLTPMEIYRKERGKEVAATIEDATGRFGEALADLANGYVAYYELAVYDPELREFVDNVNARDDIAREQGNRLFTITAEGHQLEIDDSALREAVIEVHRQMIEVAAQAAEQTIAIVEAGR